MDRRHSEFEGDGDGERQYDSPCSSAGWALEWGNGVVSMLFDIAVDSPVRLCNVVGRNMVPIDGRLSDDGKPVVEKDPRPIVEVCAANTGSQDNRLTLIATVAGSQLRFVSALASEPEPGSADPFRLEITQFAPYADLEPKGREFEPTASERDAADSAANSASEAVSADSNAGLVVTSVFEAFPNLSAVRTYTRLQSAKQLPIEAVSSLNLTVPMRVNCGKVHRSNIFWGDALGLWKTIGVFVRCVTLRCVTATRKSILVSLVRVLP